MNPCPSYQQRLVLLASGVADRSEAALLRRHCDQCPECASYLRELSVVCDGLRERGSTSGESVADNGFHQAWISRIARHREAVPPPRFRGTLAGWLGQAGARALIGGVAVALVVGAWLAWENHRFSPGGATVGVSSAGASADLGTWSMDSSTVSARSYRLAANRSAEAFDQLLARNARAFPSDNGLVHAFRGRRLEIAE